MNFRTGHSHLSTNSARSARGMALCLIVGALSALAGDPIEFSSPANSVSAPRRNSPEPLFNNPFESLKMERAFNSALDPVFPLPMPSAQPSLSRKEKEERDLRRDWAFQTPDKAFGKQTVEEALNLPQYGPEGLQNRTLSPMEKYLSDPQQKKRPGDPNNPLNQDQNSLWKTRDKDSDRQSPNGLFESDTDRSSLSRSEKNLRDVFNPSAWRDHKSSIEEDKINTISKPGELQLSDLLNSAGKDREKTREHQTRMDEFRQMLGNSSLSGALPVRSDSSPSPVRSLDDLKGSSQRNALNPFDNFQGSGPSVKRGAIEDYSRRMTDYPTATPKRTDALDAPVRPKAQPGILVIPRRDF